MLLLITVLLVLVLDGVDLFWNARRVLTVRVVNMDVKGDTDTCKDDADGNGKVKSDRQQITRWTMDMDGFR